MNEKRRRNKVSLNEDGLNRHPVNFGDGTWYYEETNGIAVYEDGRRVCLIPWRSLMASCRRKQVQHDDTVAARIEVLEKELAVYRRTCGPLVGIVVEAQHE